MMHTLHALHRAARGRLAMLSIVGLAACAGGSDVADSTAADDTTAVAAATAATGSTTGAAQTTAAGMIDPNAATHHELMAAGLDSAAASAVLAGRPYADMRGVDRALAGRMTAEQRKAAYATLWKPIDLNTATDAEILLIPGIGNRMLHEFKEYRPYTSIEQFRREMGKYVDNNEVARLEKYVMIK